MGSSCPSGYLKYYLTMRFRNHSTLTSAETSRQMSPTVVVKLQAESSGFSHVAPVTMSPPQKREACAIVTLPQVQFANTVRPI